MADPKLTLFNGSTQIDANDNWAGDAAVRRRNLGRRRVSVPEFHQSRRRAHRHCRRRPHRQFWARPPATSSSRPTTPAPGNSPRLTNLSALNRVGTGGDVLIAGFTLTGTGTKNVLIRAIGPSLCRARRQQGSRRPQA